MLSFKKLKSLGFAVFSSFAVVFAPVLFAGVNVDTTVSLDITPNPTAVGGNAHFTVQPVYVSGSSDLFAPVVSITVPGGLESSITNIVGADWDCSIFTGTLECYYIPGTFVDPVNKPANLGAIEFDIQSAPEGSYAFRVLMYTENGEVVPDPSPNDITVIWDVSNTTPAESDLSVVLTEGADPVFPLTSTSFGVTYQNQGPQDASNVILNIDLPILYIYSGFTALDHAWACTQVSVTKAEKGSGHLQCVLPGLAAGESGSIDFNGYSTFAEGNYTSTATIQADETDPLTTNNTDVITTLVRAELDVSTSTRASTDQADVGDSVRFNAVIQNHSDYGASNFEYVFAYSRELSLKNVNEPSDWNCDSSFSNRVVCTTFYVPKKALNEPKGEPGIGFLPAQAVKEIEFVFEVDERPGSGEVEGESSVSFAEHDIQPNNNTSRDTIQVGQAQSDIYVEKTAVFDAPLLPGDFFQYHITIGNNGPDPAPEIRFADQLPDHVKLLTLEKPYGWSCSPESGTAVLIECGFNRPLSPPDQQTIVLNVELLDTGLFETDVEVTTSAEDSNPNNNVDSLVIDSDLGVVLPNQTDLMLSATASTSNLLFGEDYFITYTVQNSGDETELETQLTVSIPNTVQYLGKQGPDWLCDESEGQLVCDLQTELLGSESASISIDFRAPNETQTIQHTANVSGQNPDSNPGNNQTVSSFEVESDGGFGNVYDLELLIDSEFDQVRSGDQFNLNLNVMNFGPASAPAFEMQQILPPGLELIQASGLGWNCDLQDALTLICDHIGLDNDESTTLTLDFTASSESEITLSSTARLLLDNTPDFDQTNNEASFSLQVLPPLNRDLALTGRALEDTVRAGQELNYEFTLDNIGEVVFSSATLNLSLTGPAAFEQSITKNLSCRVISDQSLSCDLDSPLQPQQQIELEILAVSGALETDSVITLEATVESDGDINTQNDTIQLQVGFEHWSEDDIQSLLEDAAGDDEIALGVVGPLGELCASPLPAEEAMCEAMFDALDNGDFSSVRGLLRAFSPRAVISQKSSMTEVSAAQFQNIDARLSELRGGGGGFASNGLRVRYGEQSLQLASLRYLMNDDEAADQTGVNDFVSPWGFFVNGTISAGERDPSTREMAFEFESAGLTAGVDYRFSQNLVLGAALGYADFSSDDMDGGSLDTSAMTLTGYTSWYFLENFYVDSKLSHSWIDVDQARSIEFSIGQVSQSELAKGSTDSTQVNFATSIGYHYNKNGWTVTPNLSLRYLSTEVNAYEETGDLLGRVRYEDFEFDSMQWVAGIQVSKALSLSNGVLTPQIEATLNHETQNDGLIIEARFIGPNRTQPFLLQTDEPDRTFGSAGGGLVFVSNGGKQYYFTYRQLLGLDDFSRYTLNLGMRMEF